MVGIRIGLTLTKRPAKLANWSVVAGLVATAPGLIIWLLGFPVRPTNWTFLGGIVCLASAIIVATNRESSNDWWVVSFMAFLGIGQFVIGFTILPLDNL